MKGTIALVVVLTLVGIAGAEDLRVNDESIVFLYESRAEIPAPDHYVAGRMSVDYRRAEDEFTRHELMLKIKPVMEKRMREATAVPRVYLVVGSNLGDYDFDRNGFPTGMGEGIFVDFDDYYIVTFATVQGLNARLFVDAQNQCFVGRMEVETDHMADLFDEQRVLRELEGLGAVGFKGKGSPDTTDGALAQTRAPSH